MEDKYKRAQDINESLFWKIISTLYYPINQGNGNWVNTEKNIVQTQFNTTVIQGRYLIQVYFIKILKQSALS